MGYDTITVQGVINRIAALQLAVAGLITTGNIVMGDNDITGCDEISFSSSAANKLIELSISELALYGNSQLTLAPSSNRHFVATATDFSPYGTTVESLGKAAAIFLGLHAGKNSDLTGGVYCYSQNSAAVTNADYGAAWASPPTPPTAIKDGAILFYRNSNAGAGNALRKYVYSAAASAWYYFNNDG